MSAFYADEFNVREAVFSNWTVNLHSQTTTHIGWFYANEDANSDVNHRHFYFEDVSVADVNETWIGVTLVRDGEHWFLNRIAANNVANVASLIGHYPGVKCKRKSLCIYIHCFANHRILEGLHYWDKSYCAK